MDFERTELTKAAVKLVLKKAIPGVLQGSLFCSVFFHWKRLTLWHQASRNTKYYIGYGHTYNLYQVIN